MTKEEKAVYEFENILGELGSTVEVTEGLRNACRTVIETLQQQPCEDKYLKEIDHLRKYIIKLETQIVEQEPCDDAVNRQAVEEMIKAEMPERGMWEIEGDKEKETVCEVCVDLIQKLSQLPPVTPQQKIGHWITWKEAGNEIPSETRFECSVCYDAAQTLCNGLDLLSSYCPNCGAKMVEDTGSEG